MYSILTKSINRGFVKTLNIFIVLALAMGLIMSVNAQDGKKAKKMKMMKMVKKMQKKAPAKGYLKAHKDVQKPFELFGGPIKIHIAQSAGGVFVSLPDNRKLDPRVFGTPEMPQSFAGTPGITGVPVPMRGVENGQFTAFKAKSPFGDKHIVLPGGHLEINAVDATATDAAVTNDKVQMNASWKDKDGNTYTVKCCKKMAAHGMEFPTFGGVATNMILHGFSNIGTPLMPSEYTYFAFWGMGSVSKNGEVLAQPRLIHGMLTEYVRTEGYKLGFDEDVTPTRRQFHLMVAPFKPNMETGAFEKSPVHTGFKLPNGMELPFWHVMFETLDISASR